MSEIQLRNTPLYAIVDGGHTVQARNVPMYAVVQDVPVMQLREVSGYVLEQVPPEMQLREISGYVLISQNLSGYIFMDGLAAFKAAVLKEQGVALVPSLCSIGDPTTVSGFFDTRVKLTAAPTADVGGSHSIYYARFPLSEAFLNQDTSTIVGAGNTIHSRLGAINSLYGMNLAPRDIVDGPVANGSPGFTLKAAATSYLFAPGSEVLIGTVGEDLSFEIKVSDLNGFGTDLGQEIVVSALNGFSPAE